MSLYMKKRNKKNGLFKIKKEMFSFGITLVMLVTMAVSLVDVSVNASAKSVIDTAKKGSLTIYKYDITEAEKNGVDVSAMKSTGEQNKEAENLLADYAIEGVEFSYLRVGDVETMSESGNVKLIYELPSELQNIIGLSSADAVKTTDGKEYFTSQQINEAMAAALLDNTSTKNQLEDYIASGTAMSLTSASGMTEATNLDLGLYLIVETKVPENVTYTTNPWFVQVPMTNVAGDAWFYDIINYPKNQTGNPTLEKKVRNNPDSSNVVTTSEKGREEFIGEREEYTYADTVTASEGELLDYRIVSKLPHITSTATYLKEYTFTDCMSKGLKYGEDVVIAFYDQIAAIDTTNKTNVDESAPIAVWNLENGKFDQSYGITDEGKPQMILTMKDEGLKEINENYSDKYMVIYYTASVNSDTSVISGDKGNPNDVTLEWRRTSQEYYDTLKDRSIVYTYGIDLLKNFSDEKGDPTKVAFTLENQTDQYFVKATGSNGVYYVTGKVKSEEEATQFRPSSVGTLLIHGIEADTYAMTETQSDTGYSLLKEPMIVKINATTASVTPTDEEVSVQTVKATATVDGTEATMNPSKEDTLSENALVKMEVLNSKGFLLPQTGGRGMCLLTILGALIAATGFFFATKKSR